MEMDTPSKIPSKTMYVNSSAKKKVLALSEVKSLRDISRIPRIIQQTLSPIKKVKELAAPVETTEKKDINDSVSIFIQSTVLDKYGFNGYHSEYCPSKNMHLIQKINRMMYQCYDLKFSALQIDEFLPKFQLLNEESLYIYYITYKELYEMVPLAKQIFYSYNLTKISKIPDIAWMNLSNFKAFCTDIRANLEELELMKIFYISSRSTKVFTHEDNLYEWLSETLVKNADIRNDYSLTFSHFLEAIVRLSRIIWKDNQSSICEQINKIHHFTLKLYAKKRLGFHIYDIIQESVFQKILNHYSAPLLDIFHKYKINCHKGYIPDIYHTFGRMSFHDFVTFLRHSTLFIGPSTLQHFSHMQDIDLSAEIAHLSLPQMNNAPIDLNLPQWVKDCLLDLESESRQLDLFKFQVWQAFEYFIAAQETFEVYNLTEFIPQDEKSVCIQEYEFITAIGIISYIRLLKMPKEGLEIVEQFDEGLQAILAHAKIQHPLYFGSSG
jgi:hypothetical protein